MGDTPDTPPPADTAAEDFIPTPVEALEAVEHPNLVAALAAAQAEFPRIPKNHTAEVRGKDGKPGYTYDYADLGDVLAATRPILARHGLALTQQTKHRERDGRLELITAIRHGASGEVLDSELELGASPGNPQQFGGALTYLRRYEMVTLLGVAAEQDLDAKDVDPVAPAGTPPPPPLPDWARPVGGDKRREFIEAVAPLVGPERATRFADNIAGSYGGLPAAVVATCRSLARAIVEDLDPLALADAEEKRQAKKTAAAQDAQAEAADTPAPEPASQEAAVDETAAAIAAAEAAGIDTSDVDPEGKFDEAEELTPAPAAGDAELGAKPPASVPAPELDGDASPVEQIKALRAAGCICESPITVDDNQRSSACPIIGHGIGF